MSDLVAIISDTHEDIRMISRAIRAIQERKPALVIHCGDIISPPVVERFQGLPMRFVFGNNDGERSGLKKKCEELHFAPIEDTAVFDFAGRKFFVNHGTRMSVIDEAVSKQEYDYVLHGHTHQRREEVVEKTKIINPGALFAALEFSIAFLEAKTGKLEFVEIPD